MRTQGINLHVAHHCFSSSISSPPSPSLETKNRKRRRLLETIGNASRRISGERLSIETIRRIIDRSKRKKGGVKREKRIVCTRALLSQREFLFRESLSTRPFPREIPREREKKRVSSEAGGGDLWMKIVGETGAERELIVCRIFIQYSFRVRLRSSFLAI